MTAVAEPAEAAGAAAETATPAETKTAADAAETRTAANAAETRTSANTAKTAKAAAKAAVTKTAAKAATAAAEAAAKAAAAEAAAAEAMLRVVVVVAGGHDGQADEQKHKSYLHFGSEGKEKVEVVNQRGVSQYLDFKVLSRHTVTLGRAAHLKFFSISSIYRSSNHT